MAELSCLIWTYVNRLWDSKFLPAINQEEVGIYMNDTVGEPAIHHDDEVVMAVQPLLLGSILARSRVSGDELRL